MGSLEPSDFTSVAAPITARQVPEGADECNEGVDACTAHPSSHDDSPQWAAPRNSRAGRAQPPNGTSSPHSPHPPDSSPSSTRSSTASSSSSSSSSSCPAIVDSTIASMSHCSSSRYGSAMSTGPAACFASSCITLHGRPAGLTRVGEHHDSTMSATGSSVTFLLPSKGERRHSSRAGGEQRTHGEDAGPEDLVCARSAGGWRGGGDASGFGDALICLRTRSKGLEEERYTMTRP